MISCWVYDLILIQKLHGILLQVSEKRSFFQVINILSMPFLITVLKRKCRILILKSN